MDSAIDTCNDYFPKLMRKHKAQVGVIAVLHPFGKDMKFQPHLHLIITEGAFDNAGKFTKLEFIPARNFSRVGSIMFQKTCNQQESLEKSLHIRLRSMIVSMSGFIKLAK